LYKLQAPRNLDPPPWSLVFNYHACVKRYSEFAQNHAIDCHVITPALSLIRVTPLFDTCHAEQVVETVWLSAMQYKSCNSILIERLTDSVRTQSALYRPGHNSQYGTNRVTAMWEGQTIGSFIDGMRLWEPFAHTNTHTRARLLAASCAEFMVLESNQICRGVFGHIHWRKWRCGAQVR